MSAMRWVKPPYAGLTMDPRDPTARHVLEELLARGGDVTAKDDKGQTAEDWAVLYHRKELAERFRKIRESRAEK